ncbi:cAMP-regulated phosphoprotein 21 [Nilaparvata lugens]|uniref:cAMP-regulated phosphoprotein 21 n=1 Tax=Nilaparvata lugens TaxID=108931 RepID=UPI00193E02E6|nr:cAMP-regulated phosphoprotein 21 [Nilaparvata lugens]XP_039298410.1 cAMP-regulated phosphoprotein 21 [Nilaparvata lugens]
MDRHREVLKAIVGLHPTLEVAVRSNILTVPGVDLEQFIAETLNRNQKDRILLLKIEHELVTLAKDTKRTVHKFPPMSSYQRMLVHRAAAYFGMEHNLDPAGHSVIVNTTKATRIPDSRFKQHLREDLLFPEEPRKSILKRDSASFEETGSFKSVENGDPRRSKSFEEREEEYEKVRRRIFNRNEESGSFEELGSYQDASWVSPDSENVSSRQRTNCSERPSARLLKVESYESRDALRANSLRQTVSKSYSFGGYDQSQPTTRILTKTDSGSSMSSRLSPSSSGYKSQSQRSDTTTTTSATPSPTATPHPHLNQMSSQSGEGVLSPDVEHIDRSNDSTATVVWAVTNITAVPAGSVLINPQTGLPYTNADGSLYHYDPDNPPRVIDSSLVTSPPTHNNNIVDSNNTDSNKIAENANNSCSTSDSAQIVQEAAPPQKPTSPPPPPTVTSSATSPIPPPEATSRPPSPPEAPPQEAPPKDAPKQEAPPKEAPPQKALPQEKPAPKPQPAAASKPSPTKQSPIKHQPPRRQDSVSSTSHHANNSHPPHSNSSQNTNGFRESDKYVHHPVTSTTHYGHQPQHGSPLPHHGHHYPMAAPGPMYPTYPPGTYNIVLQPPCPNQQPPGLMYTSTHQPVPPYDHMSPEMTDLSGYMMGVNMDGSRNTATHNADNRAGPAIYWSYPQMPQGQNKSVPLYYAPASSQVAPPRFNQPGPPPSPAYQPYPPERPGINPYSGNDCNMTYPQPALQMYYSPQCNNGNGAPSQPTASWNNGAPSNNSAPLVTLQYPATPTPPQNLCANVPYAMYNGNGYGMRLGGCYQYPGANVPSNPLGNPQPGIPLPHLYRPPNLPVGRGNGPRGSPGMKDMNDFGAHMPVYGLRVMPGNANRLSFALSSNGVKPVPAHHMRKPRPNSTRPLLMTTQPTHQQNFSHTGYLMSTVAP